MTQATWNDQIIASSDDTLVVERNHYFPKQSVNQELLRESDHRSTCPWKGEAHYFDVVVDGETLENAAWYYPDPKAAAEEIKGRVAFWKGVEVG